MDWIQHPDALPAATGCRPFCPPIDNTQITNRAKDQGGYWNHGSQRMECTFSAADRFATSHVNRTIDSCITAAKWRNKFEFWHSMFDVLRAVHQLTAAPSSVEVAQLSLVGLRRLVAARRRSASHMKWNRRIRQSAARPGSRAMAWECNTDLAAFAARISHRTRPSLKFKVMD